MLRLSLTAILATTCAASAQYVGTATHHLTFREIDALSREPVANPNGSIEPGEAALISLSISFTPPVGTVVHSPPPQPSPVTIVALGLSRLNLIVGPGGVWHDWHLAPGWDLLGPDPNPAGTSVGWSIGGIQALQAVAGANTSNPVQDLWQGVWQPITYTNRMQGFYTMGFGSNPAVATLLWTDYGGPPQQYILSSVETQFANLGIPISIPAPGASSLLAGGFAFCCLRRRRRGE